MHAKNGRYSYIYRPHRENKEKAYPGRVPSFTKKIALKCKKKARSFGYFGESLIFSAAKTATGTCVPCTDVSG